MVTARRSTEMISSAYEPAVGGVDLLERPHNYEEVANAADTSACTDYSQEEARRRNNLDRLLNYDRYSEQTAAPVNSATETATETVSASLNEEDIRPTSTTMQFGEDMDNITKEMNRAAEADSNEGYHLNKKGKIVVMLYALVVTVILALIVLNTGVLATLSSKSSQKAAELTATIARYDALQEEIASMTDSDYIIRQAEEELGMIKK